MYNSGSFWVEDCQFCRYCSLNSLPNDKILDKSKLEVFADDKIDVLKMMISLLDRVENTVGNGENAGYQHFLRLPQCFPNPVSYFCSFIVATGCPSERCPQKTVSCYGG